MSANECKRCGGEGMHGYKHVAGGVCFACGRTPAGTTATPAQLASARERLIGGLYGIIRRARAEQAEGTLQEWWADITTCEDTCLKARVETAPADVRDRAIAAFAALGLTL